MTAATMMPPFNLMKWIDDNRDLLKPPVGNKLVYQDTEFIVMVVGGPNARKDFHINYGEEFFYQLKGDIVLRVHENGAARDIPIREGEIFLLPPLVPHSPQRPADTVGLVIERQRRKEKNENDGVRWYCDNCGEIVHEVQFFCTNLGTQLKPVIEAYYGSEASRTCKKCGHVNQVPGK
ncbi:MAG: 3-hydroxyanthranilate 3,4-dioxygenase [Planctomycetota bacterium]